MYKISGSATNTNSIKYDVIVTKDINKIPLYSDILELGGKILLLCNINDITIELINLLNQSLKTFEQIELISPSVSKLTGEFIICLGKTTNIESINVHYIENVYGTIMLKANNFFDYHLKIKFNKTYN